MRGYLGFILTALFFVLPLCFIFIGRTADFETLFSFPLSMMFIRSLGFALITGLVTVFLSIITGTLTFFYSKKTQSILLFFFSVPFWSNGVLRLMAWNKFFLETDFSQSLSSVFLVLSYSYFPIASLIIIPQLWNIPKEQLLSAKILGANFYQVFEKIIIPSLKKVSIVAFFLVFTPCIGEFVIPDLIGGGRFLTVGNFISMQVLVTRQWPSAIAMMIIITLPILLLAAWVSRWARDL